MSTLNAVPSGSYKGEIVSVSKSVAKNGCEVVEWLVRIIEGSEQGTIITKRYFLKGNAVGFLHKEMGIIGLQFKNQSDFNEAAQRAVGVRFTFEAVLNVDGYQSYYVKELLPPAPTSEQGGGNVGW